MSTFFILAIDIYILERKEINMLGSTTQILTFTQVPRVTFLYHYLPSLLYATILFGIIIDRVIPLDESVNSPPFPNIPIRQRKTIYISLAITAFAFFVFFSPDTYAFPMSKAERESRRWFENWH